MLVLIAGRPRISSPKIATRTATATLGLNHEAASEPHHTTKTLACRPFHGLSSRSPRSASSDCCQLSPFAWPLSLPAAVTQKATRSCPKNHHQLCAHCAQLARCSSVPACRVLSPTVSLSQCRGGGHEGTSRNGRHPITTKKSPAHRKLQPSWKSTSTNEQFRTRFHLT